MRRLNRDRALCNSVFWRVWVDYDCVSSTNLIPRYCRIFVFTTSSYHIISYLLHTPARGHTSTVRGSTVGERLHNHVTSGLRSLVCLPRFPSRQVSQIVHRSRTSYTFPVPATQQHNQCYSFYVHFLSLCMRTVIVLYGCRWAYNARTYGTHYIHIAKNKLRISDSSFVPFPWS